MKLLITLPRPDESITSVLDRAACAYATSREELAEELIGRGSQCRASLAGADLDTHPPHRLIQALAQALGVTADWVDGLRIPASQWLLDPNSRTAYCPSCFAEGHTVAGNIYMRRAWAYSFMTHCPRHKRPLVGSVQPRWKHGGGLTRDLRMDPVMGGTELGRLIRPHWREYSAPTREEWERLGPVIHVLWVRQCQFEENLLRSCLRGSRTFDRRSAFYRDIVILFSGNWSGCDGFPLVNQLTPHALTHMILFAHLPAYPPDEDIREVWQQFLQRPHPRWRRTFVWILMQCVHKESPFDILWIYDATNRNSGTLATISRTRWFDMCFDRLSEHGRKLARAFAVRWPTRYRQIVEGLLADVPYADLKTQNESRITAWKRFLQQSQAEMEAAVLEFQNTLKRLKE